MDFVQREKIARKWKIRRRIIGLPGHEGRISSLASVIWMKIPASLSLESHPVKKSHHSP